MASGFELQKDQSSDIVQSTFYEGSEESCDYMRPNTDWRLFYSSESDDDLSYTEKKPKTPSDLLQLTEKLPVDFGQMKPLHKGQFRPGSNWPLVCSWEDIDNRETSLFKSNADAVNRWMKEKNHDRRLKHSSSDEEDFVERAPFHSGFLYAKEVGSNQSNNRFDLISSTKYKEYDCSRETRADELKTANQSCSDGSRKGQKRPSDIYSDHVILKQSRDGPIDYNFEDEDCDRRTETEPNRQLKKRRTAKSDALNRIRNSFQKGEQEEFDEFDGIFKFDEEDYEPSPKKKRRTVQPKKKKKPAPFPRMKVEAKDRVKRRNKVYTMKIKKLVGVAAKKDNALVQQVEEAPNEQCTDSSKWCKRILENFSKINEMAMSKTSVDVIKLSNELRTEIDGLQNILEVAGTKQKTVPQKKGQLKKLYTEPEPEYDGIDMSQVTKQQKEKTSDVAGGSSNQTTDDSLLSKSHELDAANSEDHRNSIIGLTCGSTPNKPDDYTIDLDNYDDVMQMSTGMDDDFDVNGNHTECTCRHNPEIVHELRIVANALNKLADLLESNKRTCH